MFGSEERQSAFGTPSQQGAPRADLAAHFAQQAAAHAQRQPLNVAAQQAAAAWAAQAAAQAAAPQQAPSTPFAMGPIGQGYTGYEPPTPPNGVSAQIPAATGASVYHSPQNRLLQLILQMAAS